MYGNRESLSFFFHFRPLFSEFLSNDEFIFKSRNSKKYKKIKSLDGFVFEPILLNEKIAHNIQTNVRANNENINVFDDMCEMKTIT